MVIRRLTEQGLVVNKTIIQTDLDVDNEVSPARKISKHSPCSVQNVSEVRTQRGNRKKRPRRPKGTMQYRNGKATG